MSWTVNNILFQKIYIQYIFLNSSIFINTLGFKRFFLFCNENRKLLWIFNFVVLKTVAKNQFMSKHNFLIKEWVVVFFVCRIWYVCTGDNQRASFGWILQWNWLPVSNFLRFPVFPFFVQKISYRWLDKFS